MSAEPVRCDHPGVAARERPARSLCCWAIEPRAGPLTREQRARAVPGVDRMRTARSTDDTSAGAVPEKRQSTFFTRSPELVNSICPAKVSQCWQATGLPESTHRTKNQSSIGQSITILCVISSEIGASQPDASTRRHTPTRRSPLTHRRLADAPSFRVSRWGRFQRGGPPYRYSPWSQRGRVTEAAAPVDANSSLRRSAPSSRARRTDS